MPTTQPSEPALLPRLVLWPCTLLLLAGWGWGSPSQPPLSEPPDAETLPAETASVETASAETRTAPTRSRAVLPDGELDEWQGMAPAWRDPSGDGSPGGLDLGTLYLADDGESLFLALDVGRETILQNAPDEPAGTDLRLFLDQDARAQTGLQIGDLGAEVEIRFGRREVLRYGVRPGETEETEHLTPGAYGLQTLPTHSASRFEIRLPLPRSGHPLRLFLQAGTGDRLPDTGHLAYSPSPDPLSPPEPISLDRPDDTLRLLSLNLNRRLDEPDSDPADVEAQARILRTTRPDVVNLQELYTWNAEQARAWVTEVLPLGPGSGSRPSGADEAAGSPRWHVAKAEDCVTLSRFPVTASTSVDGNLVVALDVPATGGADEQAVDLVIFNVHPPCCEDDAGRDREMDHVAATWRDLLRGEGPFPVPSDVGAVILGDFNYVGFRRQVEVVRDGVFIDPEHGPAFSPGRSRGSLAVAPLRHSHARWAYTWRDDGSAYAPGRLDWVFYTADALELVKGYILDTTTMPPAALEGWDLEPTDSLRASDHRALVVDFRVR